MHPEDTRQSECAWLEIGIVADEKTSVAARVCIQHGAKYPLPAIQLGMLIGDDRRFSPFLHPSVSWAEGKGTVMGLGREEAIPEGLVKQINELLRPHLVERRTEAIRQLLNYTLDEAPAGQSVVTRMSCLSCS
jgi:hypothetical protein